MDAPYPSTPGERFQAARKRAKLTQVDVATRAGVKQSTVSEFEGGQNGDIKASSLIPMCVAVGVTAEYVWTGARAARTQEEDEALTLLRGAGDAERAQAIKALRGMFSTHESPAVAGVRAATERATASLQPPPAPGKTDAVGRARTSPQRTRKQKA